MALPKSPSHIGASGSDAAATRENVLDTISTGPPLSSAKHVSYCLLSSVIRCATALPMGVAPKSMCNWV